MNGLAVEIVGYERSATNRLLRTMNPDAAVLTFAASSG
jgi:hypothetical protein